MTAIDRASTPPPPRHRADLIARRVVARLVDLLTAFFLTFALAVTVLFAAMAPLTDLLDLEPWGRRFAPTLLFVAVVVTYEATFVARSGQSPGKDLLRLRITSAIGELPGTRTAVIRAGVLTAPFLMPGFAWTIAAFVALTLPIVLGRSGFHEVLTATVVGHHDADALEGPPADDRLACIEDRYGPRSWWSAFTGGRLP